MRAAAGAPQSGHAYSILAKPPPRCITVIDLTGGATAFRRSGRGYPRNCCRGNAVRGGRRESGAGGKADGGILPGRIVAPSGRGTHRFLREGESVPLSELRELSFPNPEPSFRTTHGCPEHAAVFKLYPYRK